MRNKRFFLDDHARPGAYGAENLPMNIANSLRLDHETAVTTGGGTGIGLRIS
jgi:hypothetical protein